MEAEFTHIDTIIFVFFSYSDSDSIFKHAPDSQTAKKGNRSYYNYPFDLSK